MEPNQAHVQASRKLGESLKTQGFFEIDFIDGRITWANDFALSKMEYNLEQIKTLSIFDLVPEEFQEYARNSMSDKQNGNHSHYELWPFLSADKNIIWWYTTKINTLDAYIWLKGEYLNKTVRFSAETSLMLMTLKTVQTYNELTLKIEKQEERLERLEHESLDHDNLLDGIGKKLENIEKIARSAANSSFENSENLKKFEEMFTKALDEQTAEILRLIMTDSVHDERMKNFNAEIQKASTVAVSSAIEKITEQSKIAGTQIIKKANEAGGKVTRRVTIPIGLLMLLMTIIQIIIQLVRH